MPALLILTAGYGEGHNAAARGLHAACSELGIVSEIADPFAALGAAYEHSRRCYLELINRAPKIWAATYHWIDRWPVIEFVLPLNAAVQQALDDLLAQKQPRVVVSVYPIYSYLIARLYPNSAVRPFRLHTVITDSITINRAWHRAPSDTLIVPNPETAAVIRAQGVGADMIHDLGFPVPPRFARDRPVRPPPGPGVKPRLLFMINAGKSIAPAIVARLLEIEGLELSVTVGRDESLRERVLAAAAGRDLEIHGWTPRMPELLMSHHLLIGKAGGAAVQETIAAQTPMLITHVVPGQEEGNARLLIENGCGAICPTPELIAEKVRQLFASDAREWGRWRSNIERLSRPDAALQIARFVAGE